VRVAAAIVLGWAAALAGGGVAHAASGSWTGTYTLPLGADPVAVSVVVHGATATVALGPGHSSSTVVSVRAAGPQLRFAFPGLPSSVVFDGRRRGRVIAGTVSQGPLRGAFRLARGASRVLPLLGLYRSAEGRALAIVKAETLPPWIVELPSGATHGIGPSLTVGDLLGDISGNGTIAVDPTGFSWNGTHYARVTLRQREVRVGVGAATLTLPPGPGPFPAVAMVHGSGPQTREEFQVFAAYCELLGIAVLADDKRGVGQSRGAYPGERADDATVDVLARDAQAEVRFLAHLPEVDPARVGLLGDSQAGWIIALAAAREPAARWAVALAGPTVSTDETDLWGGLAGKSQVAPTGTQQAMLAQVRAQGPAGFDPRPSLRTLSIPVFWLFGDDDRNVPTTLCVEALEQLRAGHDFSWAVLPMTHALLLLPTGLYGSLARSPGFAPGLYPAVGDWLRAHGLSS
jgi:pimeloyl-ACP methyl ester carboxylesterase